MCLNSIALSRYCVSGWKWDSKIKSLTYYIWYLIILQLDHSHAMMVWAKKSNRILNFIFNYNVVMLKLEGKIALMGSSQRSHAYGMVMSTYQLVIVMLDMSHVGNDCTIYIIIFLWMSCISQLYNKSNKKPICMSITNKIV